MKYRVFNTWDGIKKVGDDDYVVSFGIEEYGTPEFQEVVKLNVSDGIAKVGMSSVLPTRNWEWHAFAYQRAMEFKRNYSLKD